MLFKLMQSPLYVREYLSHKKSVIFAPQAVPQEKSQFHFLLWFGDIRHQMHFKKTIQYAERKQKNSVKYLHCYLC